MEPLVKKPAIFIKKTGIYLLIFWTVIIFTSLGINIYKHLMDTINEVTIKAQADYEFNVHIRKFMSDLGGFYAPVDKVEPNPYLLVPDRDIKTTDGKILTMVNSAYMMRMIFENIRNDSKYPVLNKLTSLKYFNPANKPDDWEKKGLLEFEKGKKEISEITKINGEPYLRLMKPFFVDESCLECHGHQEYKTGDIIGGINISLPMRPYYDNELKTRNFIIITHLLIWILVGFGIYLISRIEINNIIHYEETRDLSLHDALTGLANRRLMDINFEIFLARVKRYGSKLSVIMLDIDRFKNFNDKGGHEEGDRLLCKISEIIQNEIRGIDVAVRYGGEEFLIILPDTGSMETFEVAERIRKNVEARSEVTVSLGVSSFTSKMETKEDIIREADKALYSAKNKGRNTIVTSG